MHQFIVFQSIMQPARVLPSIFDDKDNVYNSFALPSEDPRKAHQYANTGAATPKAHAAKRAA